MSEHDVPNHNQDDPVIAAWQAKRGKPQGQTQPSGGHQGDVVDPSAKRYDTGQTKAPDTALAETDLQALVEVLLSEPKPALAQLAPTNLDAIRERSGQHSPSLAQDTPPALRDSERTHPLATDPSATDDPWIAGWRAKRAQVDATTKQTIDLTAPTTASSDGDLQALAEHMLNQPAFAGDFAPTRADAARDTGKTDGAALDRLPKASPMGDLVGGMPFDSLTDRPPPRKNAPRSATEDAVATAVASSQGTIQTHLPAGNEIEEARALMLARRRLDRRKALALLAVTVLAPVLIILVYLSAFVTPLYEARSTIAISQPNQGAQGSGSGLLGAISGGANMPQTFKADEYLRSDALIHDLTEPEWSGRLAEAGITIEEIRAPGGLVEAIDSSLNIQGGLLTIYTRLSRPDKAVTLCGVVIELLSRHVDLLETQLRDKRLSVAKVSVDEARADLRQARRALLELQISTGDIDPRQRITGTYTRIAEIETQTAELMTQLDRSTVAGSNDIYETERLKELIGKLKIQADTARRSLVANDGAAKSLNEQLMDFELANQNVVISEQALSTAMSSWATTQVEVSLERSVLQIVVPVLQPTDPTYPRVFYYLFVTVLIGAAAFFTLRMAFLDHY